MKTYKTKRPLAVLAVLVNILLLGSGVGYAQFPHIADIVGGSDDLIGKPETVRSPSIVQIPPGLPGAFTTTRTTESLVAAYTYTNAASDHRKVAISRSTDNGDSWSHNHSSGGSVKELSMPNFNGNSSTPLNNMDDPQLIRLGAGSFSSNPIILVVRAWSDATDKFVGDASAYPDQPGTIPLRCGIYYCISTDLGVTWGAYNTAGTTFNENKWETIEEHDGNSTSDITTLEWPRITARPEFPNSSIFVTWTKKNYSARSGHTGEYVINSTSIGIRGINWSPFHPMTNPSTSGAPYISSSIFSGYPQRASIAIAPDNGLWIAYYTLNYNISSVSTGGTVPTMTTKFTRATYNGGSNTYSFESPQTLTPATSSETRYAMGRYMPTIGAIWYSDPSETTYTDGFGTDLASGPCIEVAANYNPDRDCQPDFHVGILYGFARVHQTSGADDPTIFDYVSDLSFYSAKTQFGESASNVNSNWSVLDHQFDETYNDANDDIRDKTHPSDHWWNARFFPTLKISRIADPIESLNGTNNDYVAAARIASCFTIAYVDGVQKKSTSGDPKCLLYGQCKVGVSFDNESFIIQKHESSSPTKEYYVINAEPLAKHEQLFSTTDAYNWGARIDIASDMAFMEDYAFVGWSVHPVWHHVVSDLQVSSDPVRLRTNTGHPFMMRAFVFGSPDNLPDAFQQGAFFNVTTSSGSSGAIWGDYGYFDFDDNQRPTSITATSPITIGSFNPMRNGSGTPEGKTFIRSFTGSPVPYGLKYAVYKIDPNDSKGGDLGYSNQRKSVMTGPMAHHIFESSDATHIGIYYSIADQLTQDGLAFSAPVKISTPTSSTCTPMRPSIAVYQKDFNSATNNSSGKAAIAITWVEFERNNWSNRETRFITARIFMKTREFDPCKGEWGAWSPQYLIHSHENHRADVMEGEIDDGTTPVIAPLMNNSSMINSLLGWSIVWTSPQLDHTTFNAITSGTFPELPTHTGIYERAWLRYDNTANAIILNNGSWGTYPASLTTPLNLRTFASSTIPFAPVFEWPTPLDSKTRPLGYPSLVNEENATNNDDAHLHEELAFTTDGSGPGVWQKALDVAHDVSSSSTQAHIGELQNNDPTKKGTWIAGPGGLTFFPAPSYSTDRNPCITMNSSGQIFVAWENMTHCIYDMGVVEDYNGQQFVKIIHVNWISSSIPTNHTFSNGAWWKGLWWNVFNNFNSALVEPANSMNYEWLLNPSIAGFPKSRLHNEPTDNNPALDKDPGAVELLNWQLNKFDPTANHVTTMDMLQDRVIYNEGHGNIPDVPNKIQAQKWIGIWQPNLNSGGNVWADQPGGNSQRSYGIFNAGPALNTWDGTMRNDDKRLNDGNGYDLGSYQLGNVALGGNIDITNVTIPLVGSFKGTYNHNLGMDVYRYEEFIKDSTYGKFEWGAVYVGDTSSSVPMRQVMLHFGVADTSSYANANAMHDSIFMSQVFNWYPGSELRYWRGMAILDSFSVMTGGPLADSSFGLKYTVELVFSTGVIDTLETCFYSPAYSNFLTPATKHFFSMNVNARDAFIRIRRQQIGAHCVPDSLWNLGGEFAEAPYPTLISDTTLVYKRGYGGNQLLGSGQLKVLPPYPNPAIGTQTVHLGITFAKGYPVRIEVRDLLGRIISDPVTFTANGDWQQQSVQLTGAEGEYFIIVTAGNESISAPVTIVR